MSELSERRAELSARTFARIHHYPLPIERHKDVIEAFYLVIDGFTIVIKIGNRSVAKNHRVSVLGLYNRVVRLPVAEMVKSVRAEHKRGVDHKS